jgi:hypothetical protein
MVDGLAASSNAFGWEDTSAPTNVRIETRSRTTFRCAAGLARASAAGVEVPDKLLTSSAGLVTSILLTDDGSKLDSPDYACGLIFLLIFRPDLIATVSWADFDVHTARSRSGRMTEWRAELLQVVSRMRSMAELGVAGYRQVLDVYESRLNALKDA